VRLAYDRRLPDGELAATSLDTIEGDLSENVDHALSQGIPVCWAGDVGEAFCASDFDPALPVEYPTKRAGAHAMVITGRKIVRASGMAVARWYLIRNSWGTGFANRGRFWMTESYMRTGDLWALNKPPLWRAPVAGGRA
jgi:C1A family cysteine protease